MKEYPCTVRLNREWRSEIEATLIALVPAAGGTHQRLIAGGKLDTITTDAVVILHSFDKGRVYQVPLDCVRITEGAAAAPDTE